MRLRAAPAFANPVQKNDERILDPNAHLTWYSAYDSVPDPMNPTLVSTNRGFQRADVGGW